MAALLTAALGGLAGCDGTVATATVEPGPPVLKLAGNLQASASIIAAWDLDNWAGSSNFVTGLTSVRRGMPSSCSAAPTWASGPGWPPRLTPPRRGHDRLSAVASRSMTRDD
jgi:hypothetical protein